MNKSLRRFFAGVAGLSFVSSQVAADSSGTTAFSALNIPVGARATALGQAFTSVSNDVQAITYNPASLTSLITHQMTFQHLSYVADISQESLAYGHAAEQNGISWGLSANYLRVASIERTIATLSPSGDGFTEAGTFSTYDMALGATGAAPLTEDLSVGGTFKFLRESLSDAASNGAAVDVGALYQGNDERSWNLGASLLNVGVASRFADAAVKLPTTLRLGFSGQPFAQWLFSTDYVKRSDTGTGELDVGAEVTPRRAFSMRLGYRYQFIRPDLGGLSDFSAGFGLRFKQFSLDYAFVPLGDLGLTHRVSLNLRFKRPRD